MLCCLPPRDADENKVTSPQVAKDLPGLVPLRNLRKRTSKDDNQPGGTKNQSSVVESSTLGEKSAIGNGMENAPKIVAAADIKGLVPISKFQRMVQKLKSAVPSARQPGSTAPSSQNSRYASSTYEPPIPEMPPDRPPNF